MVLYMQDFANTGALVHWDTKNDSAIRLSIVLKRLGIKNNYFFLALHQPELAKVDPYDPNLSAEMRTKILVECKLNVWYFLREVVRLPAPGGNSMMFQFSRSNLAVQWSAFNQIDVGNVACRQIGGKSTNMCVFCVYLMYILGEGLNIGLLVKDQTLLQEDVKRIKEIRDLLPKWMITPSARSSERKEGLFYASKRNALLTFPSPQDERAAYSCGRGHSFSVLWLEEYAYIKYIKIAMQSIIKTMLQAGAQAQREGLPAVAVYTTTAGNPSDPNGAFALETFQKAFPFYDKLYDLPNREALLKMIEESGSTRMLYVEFSYKQLGKDDAWLRQESTRANLTQSDIDRDFLNIWQADNEKSIVPQHLLAKVRASKRDPNYVDYQDGFVVRWYVEREYVESDLFRNTSTVMGMDTSENIGRDYTTFTILDPRDMKVLATCRCNLANTMQVGKHVFALLQRFPQLVWIPERNNTGIGIIDFVMDQLQGAKINPYLRIYNEVVQNLDDPKYKNIDIYNFYEIYGSARSSFGFRTTGSGAGGGTRNLLYKITLMKALEMNFSRIYDATLINEIGTLTERNGRIDHSSLCHDDQVISWLLASYLVFFGKHLDIYGIKASSVLEFLDKNGSNVDPILKEEQMALRRRIAELESLIATQPAHILRQSYVRELAQLRPLVNEDITAIDPMARTQVQYQEQEVRSMGVGNSEQALKNFVTRWKRVR